MDQQHPSKPKTKLSPGRDPHPGVVRDSPLAGNFLPAPPPAFNTLNKAYTKYDTYDYDEDDTCDTDLSDDNEDPEDLDYVGPAYKSRKLEDRSGRMLAYGEAYATTPRVLTPASAALARPVRAMPGKNLKTQGADLGRVGQGLPPAGPTIITPESHPEYIGFFFGGHAIGGFDHRLPAWDFFLNTA